MYLASKLLRISQIVYDINHVVVFFAMNIFHYCTPNPLGFNCAFTPVNVQMSIL